MRTLKAAFSAGLLAAFAGAFAACGGAPQQTPTSDPPRDTLPPVSPVAAEPSPGSLALVPPSAIPTELLFFDSESAVFLAVTVDPLDRDYGHVTVAIEGAGVAWSLEPGSITPGTKGGLDYAVDGPGRLDTGALTDPVVGMGYSLSGQIGDTTLAVTLSVAPDLLTASAAITVDGVPYTLETYAPAHDADLVSDAVNAAMVSGDWPSIWHHLDARGRDLFTPERWVALGESWSAAFDSIESAERTGVRYLDQPGVLPARAFADVTVVTATGDRSETWVATQQFVHEHGHWRVKSLGTLEPAH